MRYQAAPLPDDRIDHRARASPGSAARWWARKDSNLQPSRYERPALPLSYRPCPARVAIAAEIRAAQALRAARRREEQGERARRHGKIAAGDPRKPADQPELQCRGRASLVSTRS